METDTILFEKKANLAQASLNDIFWNSKESVYEPYISENVLETENFHYWWQAHAIDVLVDGYERTQEPQFITQIDKLLEGIRNTNDNTMINDFYDDMEWMALALLRVYQCVEEDSYLDLVKMLWKDIETGWNDICGGGFAWQKNQLYYKNTPANAPAIILALRLYQIEHDKRYLNLAKKAFSWLEDHLIDHETGFVWDGMNREQDMHIDKDWEFTYCQGVYVGACVEIFKITDENAYLKKAQKTIHTAFKRLTEENSIIIQSEGIGDGGLFKGIFIRYVEYFLSYLNDKVIENYLIENATSAGKRCRNDTNYLFGEYWSKDNQLSSITLSTHLSGCMIMESVNRLQHKKEL